ncbi:MAG TPA: L-threonylcarbamoyladenylate synthase, partial [Longimicrobiales bacterium]
TETVYGFGCLVRDDALSALAALKSRDAAKPFLLLIREAGDIPQLEWTAAAHKLAEAFWPGPLTLALRVREALPARILSSDGTLAVRATPHDGLRALLSALREPITSTSANTPGDPPAASGADAAVVLNELGASAVLILDGGPLPPSAPSTVVDCSGERPRVVREGAVTTEALAQIVEIE